MSSAKQPLDLTTCGITGGLIRFSLPFLASSILQTMYSTVDTIIVGQFAGSAGLAAVNNVSYICNAASNIGLGASAGSAVLIAQYFGAKNEAGVHRTVGTALSISTIMAIVISLIVCVFINPILTLVNIPPEARSEAHHYLMIRAACFLISFFYCSITSLLRGMGDSKRPLYFSAVASIANVALDLLFVAGFRWGAGGAALATEISELFALVWAFLYLRKHQPGILTLNPSQYRIHGPTAKMVLKIGVPSSFQYLFIDLSFVFVNSIINGFGLIAASAVAVGSKVVNLSQIGISALSTGVGTMAGQNIGAGKPERAGRTIRVGVRIALVIAIVMFTIIQIFPVPLVKLFNRDPAALEESIRCLRYLSLMAFPSAFFFIYISIATAVGFTTFSMFCHILDGVVVRVALSLLLTEVFGMGLVGVYLAMGLAPSLSAVFAAVYFYSGAWKKRKLLEANGL
ncbi:MAG: MATE family efflux transporter [Oscillospiraceae bacterium]|nr:MATE family efflux transporter [Oscillospiraceae bacterium]